jgi:hypothetical protein
MGDFRVTPIILAIDPGPRESAFVIWNGVRVLNKGKVPNDEMLQVLNDQHFTEMIIERITLYQRVNQDVHDTILWYGRFLQAAPFDVPHTFIPRDKVKSGLLRGLGAKDKNDSTITMYMIDRFGPKGTKKDPNPITHGMKADIWQAFALAVYHYDKTYGIEAA